MNVAAVAEAVNSSEVTRFLTKTPWALGMLALGVGLLLGGIFVADPMLAGITGAYGLFMTLIAVSIYAVLAILQRVQG